MARRWPPATSGYGDRDFIRALSLLVTSRLGAYRWQTTRNRWPDTIVVGLRREAMAVDVAYDGGQALKNASVNRYDAAVLDRDMLGGTGDGPSGK
jgi:hypothetical protein